MALKFKLIMAFSLLCLAPLLNAQRLPPTLLTQSDSFPSSIYPLGWSAKGLFAYQFMAQSSHQLADVGFIIIDTRTDLELFVYTEQNMPVSDNLPALFWNKHKNVFEKMLKQHQIALNAGSYQELNNNDYQSELTINSNTTPKSFVLKIKKNSQSKIVAEGLFINGMRQLALVTAVKSPLENRLVFIAVATYQNSTSMHYGHPIIYGAHLSTGFS